MSDTQHEEHAVRYRKSSGPPDLATGQQPLVYQRVDSAEIAQRAVEMRIPHSGTEHTVVKRLVTDWEEV